MLPCFFYRVSIMPIKFFDEIPVIPMRGRVIFPNTTVSFDAGRLKIGRASCRERV